MAQGKRMCADLLSLLLLTLGHASTETSGGACATPIALSFDDAFAVLIASLFLGTSVTAIAMCLWKKKGGAKKSPQNKAVDPKTTEPESTPAKPVTETPKAATTPTPDGKEGGDKFVPQLELSEHAPKTNPRALKSAESGGSTVTGDGQPGKKIGGKDKKKNEDAAAAGANKKSEDNKEKEKEKEKVAKQPQTKKSVEQKEKTRDGAPRTKGKKRRGGTEVNIEPSGLDTMDVDQSQQATVTQGATQKTQDDHTVDVDKKSKG